ncbi:unnamed protein product, partial [Rotaria sp. Silwood2]
LDVHYDATKNIMTSTYDFYSCYQKSGQTFCEWKAELCEKLNKVGQALLKEQGPDLETTENDEKDKHYVQSCK